MDGGHLSAMNGQARQRAYGPGDPARHLTRKPCVADCVEYIMILGTRHTGLVVRDLERSVAFYTEVFGLEVFGRSVEHGEFIEKLVGIPGVKLEWAKLAAPDGSLLQLLEYHSHPDQTPLASAPANRLGCSHLAFAVEDIGQVHAAFKERGLNVVNEPQVSPDGKVKVMYCHDPDGIILEVVEELNTLSLKPGDVALIVYDFDGVLTDNRVHVREDGMESVTCNRGDGWGIGMIRELGIEQLILSTEENPVVMARAAKLNLECVHDSRDKADSLRRLAEARSVDMKNVLYVGNDLNDLEAMFLCGYKVAPGDAHPAILAEADLVTSSWGGEGVIRELADILADGLGNI